MLRRHPAAEAIKSLLRQTPNEAPTTQAVLDDAAASKALENEKTAKEEGVPDKAADAAKADAGAKPETNGSGADEPVLDAAGTYQDSDIALKAVAAVQEWAETPPSDLDEGEGSGDRLFSLLAGIADDDMDGELSDDEIEIVNMAAEVAAEYMIAKGVPESDAVDLLQDFDNELAETVQELVLSAMPDGDEDAAEEIDNFVFGDGSDESVMDAAGDYRIEDVQNATVNGKQVVTFKAYKKKGDSFVHAGQFSAPKGTKKSDLWTFADDSNLDSAVIDSATLDATYRRKLVVRQGKKVRINKRVSGRVRLSPKQKIAVRKMLRKSHSAKAQLRRAKSVKIRKRSGM